MREQNRLLVSAGLGDLSGEDAPPIHPPTAGESPPFMFYKVRRGDEFMAAYSAVLRFDTAQEIAGSQLRPELIFPANNRSVASARFPDGVPSSTEV